MINRKSAGTVLWEEIYRFIGKRAKGLREKRPAESISFTELGLELKQKFKVSSAPIATGTRVRKAGKYWGPIDYDICKAISYAYTNINGNYNWNPNDPPHRKFKNSRRFSGHHRMMKINGKLIRRSFAQIGVVVVAAAFVEGFLHGWQVGLLWSVLFGIVLILLSGAEKSS